MDQLDLFFRRDEFYALITWVYNSPSFTDYSDEFMYTYPSNPKAPARRLG